MSKLVGTMASAIDILLPDLEAIYKELHAHPELSIRLGARVRVDRAGAKPRAVRAVAVPLRKAAARGRSEDMYEHGCPARGRDARQRKSLGRPRLSFQDAMPESAIRHVHRDFETETQISVGRLGPHGGTPLQ